MFKTLETFEHVHKTHLEYFCQPTHSRFSKNTPKLV